MRKKIDDDSPTLPVPKKLPRVLLSTINIKKYESLFPSLWIKNWGFDNK